MRVTIAVACGLISWFHAVAAQLSAAKCGHACFPDFIACEAGLECRKYECVCGDRESLCVSGECRAAKSTCVAAGFECTPQGPFHGFGFFDFFDTVTPCCEGSECIRDWNSYSSYTCQVVSPTTPSTTVGTPAPVPSSSPTPSASPALPAPSTSPAPPTPSASPAPAPPAPSMSPAPPTPSASPAPPAAPTPSASPAGPTPSASPATQPEDDGCDGIGSIVRKNVMSMSDQEWRDYVEAFKLLTVTPDPSRSGRSIYSQFASDHTEYGEHQNNLFLAWHREQLWKWDVALNSVKPGVMQPYFEWSVSAADIFSDRGFNVDRFGGSESTDGHTESRIPDGSFSGLESEWPSRHFVTRNFNNDPLATANMVDAAIRNIDGFENFRLVLEFEIHNAFHRAIGGDMVTPWSPNEPLFYFHHAYLDYIYRNWQNRPTVGTNSEVELNRRLRPWSETARDALDGPATTCVSYEGLGLMSARFAIDDSHPNAKEDVNFNTVTDKAEALEVVAKKKVQNPIAYKKEVKQYKKILEASEAAAVLLRRDLKQLAMAQNITATLLLKDGIVDITEADEVLLESDEELRQEGVAALVNLMDGILPKGVTTEDVIDKSKQTEKWLMP